MLRDLHHFHGIQIINVQLWNNNWREVIINPLLKKPIPLSHHFFSPFLEKYTDVFKKKILCRIWWQRLRALGMLWGRIATRRRRIGQRQTKTCRKRETVGVDGGKQSWKRIENFVVTTIALNFRVFCGFHYPRRVSLWEPSWSYTRYASRKLSSRFKSPRNHLHEFPTRPYPITNLCPTGTREETAATLTDARSFLNILIEFVEAWV